MNIRDRVLSFLPEEIEDDMIPVDRRWIIKNNRSFTPIFPEYTSILDKDVILEDRQKSDEYIFVNAFYDPIHAEIPVSSEFIKELTFSELFSEYNFILEETRKSQIIYNYEEEMICSYGGFHWTNIPALLYVIFEGYSPKDDKFVELANMYHHNKSIPIPWHEVHVDRITTGFKTFLDSIFKDPHRYIVRYLIFHRDEIIRRNGIMFFIPELEDIMDSEVLSDINNTFYAKIENTPVVNEIESKSDIPPVRDNVRFPMGRPSQSQEENAKVINFTAPIVAGGIMCYKVINDIISDKSRMNPADQPYSDSAYYDPPITRGVSKVEQPYRFKLVNSEIDMDDLDGDTSNMRKVVIGDQLTGALDWAARNGRPLPKMGTEFYIHIGDSAPESMSSTKLVIAAYSRKRKNASHILAFPDYSYQIFALNTRFHIRESHSLTWNYIRDYVARRSMEINPPLIQDRDNKIFFRGNEFDFPGIRKSLFYMQRNNIKSGGKVILNKGDLNIEIPKLSGQPLDPMDQAEMAQYSILLDLPGYGMWSTRLKFISLTRSYVVRVMFLERTWDKVKGIWVDPDPKGDLWETFTDSFLPIEFTHTVIGYYYKGNFPKDSSIAREAFEKNNKSKISVMEKIAKIRSNISQPRYQKKVDDVYERVISLTEDHINEYIYELVMKQARYYGFA